MSTLETAKRILQLDQEPQNIMDLCKSYLEAVKVIEYYSTPIKDYQVHGGYTAQEFLSSIKKTDNVE